VSGTWGEACTHTRTHTYTIMRTANALTHTQRTHACTHRAAHLSRGLECWRIQLCALQTHSRTPSARTHARTERPTCPGGWSAWPTCPGGWSAGEYNYAHCKRTHAHPAHARMHAQSGPPVQGVGVLAARGRERLGCEGHAPSCRARQRRGAAVQQVLRATGGGARVVLQPLPARARVNMRARARVLLRVCVHVLGAAGGRACGVLQPLPVHACTCVRVCACMHACCVRTHACAWCACTQAHPTWAGGCCLTHYKGN